MRAVVQLVIIAKLAGVALEVKTAKAGDAIAKTTPFGTVQPLFCDAHVATMFFSRTRPCDADLAMRAFVC